MDIRNNMTNAQASPNFGKFKVTKKAVKDMLRRGEWDEFKPLLPGFHRLGKKADITIDTSSLYYKCSVSPKQPLVKEFFHKVKTFFNAGIDERAGENSIRNYNMAKLGIDNELPKRDVKTADFKELYEGAHKDAREKRIIRSKAAKNPLNEAFNDIEQSKKK